MIDTAAREMIRFLCVHCGIESERSEKSASAAILSTNPRFSQSIDRSADGSADGSVDRNR
jgi:hypothetical protein